MIGKKINQLATELAPDSTDLTIIGDPISGVSKKITLAQLGAIFSGAVAFYTNLAAFPVTGDINVIYCAKDTQKLYLWSGSAYVEVFPSQALLNTYQLRSEKGVSNGYASLDSAGKVPIAQLPSSIMEYKGTWNAATNTPTLANGTGDTGDVYICNVAGTVNFGAGPLTFAVGDYVIYSGTIWQRSSGAVGTVTSVAASITGDAIGITGSPVTTSGTLALAFAGTSSQYINGAGNLTTFPTLTGYVPYTGATANVDLGTFDLTADIVNANDIKALSSAGLDIYSNSGTHIALFGAGGGAGVTFYGGINGTSASFSSSVTASSLIKSGGTSSQFLKADGSVDSTSYQPILTNPITGTGASGQVTYFNGTTSVTGNNNFFWDATNNRLGIGLVNPQRSLEIYNATADAHLRLSGSAPSVSMGEAITGSVYQAKFGLVTVNGQYASAGVAGDFVIISQTGATIFVTNSTEKMRVQASGNMCVGNTNDTYKLDVTGTGRFTGQLRLESTITDGTYTYTLPSATGTLALTSALSGYLPLTGGTLTGALSGTSATFSSSVTMDYNFNGSSWFTAKNTNAGSGAAAGLLMTNNGGDLGAISLLSSTNSPANALFIRTLSTNSLVFGTGNTAQMYLVSAGNVGIGTSSPVTNVDINSAISGAYTTSSSQAPLRVFNVTNAGGINSSVISLQCSTDGSASNPVARIGVVGESAGSNNGAMVMMTRDGSGVIERMRITSGGNVGIGTTSPDRPLDIYSASTVGIARIRANNANGAAITIQNDENSQSISMYAAGSSGFGVGGWAGNAVLESVTGVVYSAYNGNHIFQTGVSGRTERMRITSGGNLLIGGTTEYSGYRLQVNGANSTNSWTSYFLAGNSTSNGINIYLPGNRSSDTTYNGIAIGDDSAYRFIVYGNGNVQNTNNSYGAISDIVLKENIIDATPKLNDLLKVKIKNYNLIGDENKQIGVIAQELEQIFPSMIDINKEGLKSVKYSVFVPILIKAIQELKAELDTLKNK